ncbi:hypothetical protein [Paraburkholderia sp. UYCP14C]|uniref:hypothetical protein n=1 Tax=Paraburkholderia sp. UYCP14C TaxID=2511130 RepID=UPI001459FF9C|nr:hypothetical protein [Paraburkholderia sp. UYCP14C]
MRPARPPSRIASPLGVATWRRRQRPERGSMRAAKSSNKTSAITHTPTKMITQFMSLAPKK